MDTSSVIQLIFLIILLILSGFFSSAETALTCVNRIQVQLLADEGNKRAKKVIWILDHRSNMLSAILIGNNIVNLSASALTTTLSIKLLGNSYIGIATGVLTFLILIFGEIVPKSLATTFALKLSIAYGGIISFLMWILVPVIFIIEKIRLGIVRLLHIDESEAGKVTEDEIMGYVDAGLEEGAIETDEFEMISNVFSLDTSLARDIMIPRIDMVSISIDATREEVLELYEEHKFTRYPVVGDQQGTIIGILNIKDMLSISDDDSFHVGNIMRNPHFTFEHKEVGTLLIEMRSQAISLIIVLDEYGSTSGIITLEDILEEIVGEIRDEFDTDEKDSILPLKKEREYLVEGSTSLIDVNDALETNFESEEYDSIGGYFIESLDRLPKSGESITLENGTRLIAEVVRRNRVEKIHIFLPEPKEDDE